MIGTDYTAHVVHHDVDTTCPLKCHGHRTPRIVTIQRVGNNGYAPSAASLDFYYHGFKVSQCSGRKHYGHSIGCQSERKCAADTSTCTGDYSYAGLTVVSDGFLLAESYSVNPNIGHPNPVAGEHSLR